MTNLHDNAILDQERASAVARLQAIVDDALAGGISDQTFDEIIEEVRAEMDDRQSA